MMKYIEIKYRLLVYLTSYTVFSGDIKKTSENEKKKALKKKKSSENDQWTGHFQSLFIYFFCPPTLNLKKKSRKSTNKKTLA